MRDYRIFVTREQKGKVTDGFSEDHNYNQSISVSSVEHSWLYYNPMRTQRVHAQRTATRRNADQSEITLYPLETESTLKQCRICLVGQQGDDSSFISPCECNGSLKYVHRECLREWMQSKISKLTIDNQENAKKVTCQLCKYDINIIIQTNRSINSYEKLCQSMQQKLAIFMVCLIGTIFSLILLVYSSVQLIINTLNNAQAMNVIQNFIFVVSIILNFLLLVFFLINLAPYFIDKKVEVHLSHQ